MDALVLVTRLASPIEVKISDHIQSSDIHGLIAFQREYEPKAAIVVCTAPRLRKMTLPNGQTIDIMPWRTFLESLWNGEIGNKLLKKTQNQE